MVIEPLGKNSLENKMWIGSRQSLKEGGDAITFAFDALGFDHGFVILFDGALYGYRNQCPHTGVRLDWIPGKVFDNDGQYLVCSVHGAIFEPKSGRCLAGPCVNQCLKSIPVDISGDDIFVSLLGAFGGTT